MGDGRCDEVPGVLRRLADDVSRKAREVDELWAQSLEDGATMLRVVEASHALHRAAIALRGDDLIGAAPGATTDGASRRVQARPAS